MLIYLENSDAANNGVGVRVTCFPPLEDNVEHKTTVTIREEYGRVYITTCDNGFQAFSIGFKTFEDLQMVRDMIDEYLKEKSFVCSVCHRRLPNYGVFEEDVCIDCSH